MPVDRGGKGTFGVVIRTNISHVEEVPRAMLSPHFESLFLGCFNVSEYIMFEIFQIVANCMALYLP